MDSEGVPGTGTHAARRMRRIAATGFGPLRRLARRRRMWLRLAQCLAAATLAVTILLAVLVLRLSDGPLSVGFLTERIANAVQSQLPPGFTVAIEDTVIERDRDTADLLLRLRGVQVRDGDDHPVFAAPRAAIGLSGLGLVTGRIVPRSVWLIQPRIALTEVDGRLRLRPGGAEIAVPPGDEAAVPAVSPVDALAVVFTMLGQSGPGRGGGLSTFGVRDARLTVLKDGDRPRSLSGLGLVLSRGDEDGEITLEAGLGDGEGAPLLEGTARMALSGTVDVSAAVRNLSIDDFAPLVPFDLPFVMSGPLDADLSVQVGADGDLERVESEIRIGAGNIGVQDRVLLVDEADIAFDWHHSTGTVRIHPSRLLAGDTRFSVTGQISIPEEGDFSYGTVPLRLEFSDIVIADPVEGIPSRYTSASLEAFFVPEQRFLHIARLDLVADNTAASFVGFIGGGTETPGVKLAGSVTEMSVDNLKSTWPFFLARKARRWTIRNLHAGQILDASVDVDIAPDVIAAALRGVPMPREAFQIEFTGRDGVVQYLRGLPPVAGVAAHARLDGQELDVRMDGEARIDLPDGGTVTVPRARFFIPDIPAKPSTGIADVALAGSVREILRLLDHPPIELARRRGLKMDGFEGTGVFDMNITLPLIENLKFPDIRLVVDGEIDDFGAQEFAGARSIDDGDIDLDVVDGRIVMSGTALIDGVRAELSVDDPLLPGGAPGERSVTMTLDESARARLGLALGDFLTGPIVATVNDVSAANGGTSQQIHADLTKARISFAILGIDKPVGEKAVAEFVLSQSGTSVSLSDLKLVSDSLRVEGSAEFEKGRGLNRLSLPVVRTSRGTDVAVESRMASGTQTVSLRGKALDLRSTLASARDSGGEAAGGAGGGMRVDVDIDRAIGSGGTVMQDFSGTVMRRGSRIERLDITARTDGGVPVTLRYSDDGTNSDLSAESDDAGRVLAWAGVYPNMRDGRLRLAGARRGAEAPLGGTISIDRFRIANDPSLARLIEGGERESRERVDVPIGQGAGQSGPNVSDVGFDRLTANFQRSGPQILVSDAVLRGVAVGATIEGSLDLAAKRIALHGTYIPLYALNNLFGQLPLFLGPLLGGKPNEGLLGITYSLSGTIDAPVLTINPISVVAPGVFRYILGMDNPRAATPRTNADPASPIR